MRSIDRLLLRFRSLFSRARTEQDLDAELRFHLQQQIDENLTAGMTLEEASCAARRTVGGLAQIQEECRDMRGLNLVDNAVQDFRYAIRQLRRNPGFSCISIFVLALGICAAVTILGFVDAALIKPLPYRDQSLWQILILAGTCDPCCLPDFATKKSNQFV